MVRRLTGFGVVITIITTAAVAAAQPARAGRTKSGIAYDVQGEGPVVVLITGSNLDRRMWSREAAWLRSTRMVVRYDLRAHGASETATMPFSHVDDLLTVLDEIGVNRATLVGLSAGSTIALDAALRGNAIPRCVLKHWGRDGGCCRRAAVCSCSPQVVSVEP
jgi:pimeloyl-ACP methyl ester carboxylesterase